MTPEADKRAMDWIADLLKEEEWDPSFLERIAEVVEWTGRSVSPEDKEIEEDD